MTYRKKRDRIHGQYEFFGTATVSVHCYVEAASPEEAWAMVRSGDCSWVCDVVDGEVENIERSLQGEDVK